MSGASLAPLLLHERWRSWPFSRRCRTTKVFTFRPAALTLLTKLLAVRDDSQTVITFYATSLAPLVGQSYKPPNLVWLAKRWFETMSWVQ